jgi:hypothetical protein
MRKTDGAEKASIRRCSLGPSWLSWVKETMVVVVLPFAELTLASNSIVRLVWRSREGRRVECIILKCYSVINGSIRAQMRVEAR